MSAIAKTVSPSPLRAGTTGRHAVKITLNTPFKLKWPALPREDAVQILEELKNALSGTDLTGTSTLADLTSTRPVTSTGTMADLTSTSTMTDLTSTSTVADLTSASTVADPTGSSTMADLTGTKDPTGSSTVADPTGSSTVADLTGTKDPTGTSTVRANKSPVAKKRSQLVMGVNEVTRALEKGTLEVGLACSSSPSFLVQHLLPLAALRGIPFTTVPNLSSMVSQCLGIKRTTCIGIKIPSDGVDHFPNFCSTVSRLVPPLPVPWLNTSKPSPQSYSNSDNQDLGGCDQTAPEGATSYHPLEIKMSHK